MRKIFLIIFFLLGCSSTTTMEIYETDLLEYVISFNNKYNIKYKGSYSWGVLLPDTTLGVCIRFSKNSTKNHILINKKKWNEATELQKENIMFHELGHCALNLEHDTGFMKGDPLCPNSLMYPQWMTPECYSKYREYYLNSLGEK